MIKKVNAHLMKRIYWYIALLAVFMFVVMRFDGFFSNNTQYNDLKDLTVTSVEGESSAIAWQKKPYTIFLGWAKWCHYCMESIPFYNDLADKFSKNFNFYGLHFDPIPLAELQDLKKQHDISFPIYSIAKTPDSIWQIGKVPYVLIFSKNGTLLMQFVESVSKERLESVLEKLDANY